MRTLGASQDDSVCAHASRQRFLADLQLATQRLSEPAEVMETTARMLAEQLGADRCAYAEVEDERVFHITGDHTRGVPSIVGRWDIAAFGPAAVQHMLAGEPFVVEDAEIDPGIDPEHRPVYRATNIRGCVCVPIHKDGRLTAALAVHQREPRRWTAEEIELIGTVVARCWEVIERARVTRGLRESEARCRAIVEATPECVKILDADGRLLSMNPAGLRMLEIPTEAEAVGRCMYDLIAPMYRETFRAFNEAVCRGHGGALAFDLIGARGTRRAMETTAVPLPCPSGGFVHLAVMRDVSARVAAERALAESRARLDYAVRLSGVGFWYCDLPMYELAWDARVKAHFFLPSDARVTIETFYDRIHPEDREPTRAAIEAAIAHGVSCDVVYRTVDPASGAIKWIRALGGVSYAGDGKPARFDGVTVDVTAQKLEEERLAGIALENARLNEQLRDQDRRKDEFLATLAHELRNPLAPIRTGLYLLGLSQPPAQAARTRAMMERQLAHLVRLVDDLLDISRVTLGKIELRRERLDLRHVLDSALETTRSLLEAAGHELSVQLPEHPLPLDLDPARMSQVFANLVNNAVKYTPKGGRIAITAEEEGATLAVRVRDTGVGIPPEMLPRVFEMFTQVGRSQGGLGIGLTLVRRLVELHGGTVEAASAGAGQGSTFTVRLPLLAPPAPAHAARPGSQPGVSGIKILVVDDNVDAAESLAMLLELRGNETRLAHTGPDALAAAAAFHPQVVFLDIGLPGLDGYEVAQRLRAIPARPRPLLVAVTGWGSSDDRQRARAAGFDLHLVKPVDSVAIDAALAAWPPAD